MVKGNKTWELVFWTELTMQEEWGFGQHNIQWWEEAVTLEKVWEVKTLYALIQS